MRFAALVLFAVPVILGACKNTVVEPATSATKLAFTTQPVNGNTGVALPSVVVVAQDASGNTVTGYASPIIVSLGSNPTGDTLLGTLTRTAVSGVAVFNDGHSEARKDRDINPQKDPYLGGPESLINSRHWDPLQRAGGR